MLYVANSIQHFHSFRHNPASVNQRLSVNRAELMQTLLQIWNGLPQCEQGCYFLAHSGSVSWCHVLPQCGSQSEQSVHPHLQVQCQYMQICHLSLLIFSISMLDGKNNHGKHQSIGYEENKTPLVRSYVIYIHFCFDTPPKCYHILQKCITVI